MKSNNCITVFVAYGSFGDIYPLLGVAKQMKAEGHRVLFVANEYFSQSVLAANVDYAQAGTRDEQIAARETQDSNGNTFAGAMTRYDYLIGRNYARVAAIIQQLVASGEQLTVVTHGRLSPAFPACEQYGIPVILTYYAPSQMPDNCEDYVLYNTSFGKNEWLSRHVLYPFYRIKIRILESPINRYNHWRKQSGYRSVRHPIVSWLINILCGRGFELQPRHPNIIMEMALLPKWFADPIGDDVRHMHFTGFVFYGDDNHSNNHKVDEFISRHGSPIVFTPGTAVEDVDGFCSAIADTCKLLDAPAIVLSRYVAESMEKFDFSGAGANVLVLEHVDLGYVLPKSKLLVHHGGIGTLAQAIRAGIPQIIRPRMYDQPNNALRVALNGLGGMLYDDGYTATEIASVYLHLTSSELHRAHLDYYRDAVRNEHGDVNAALAIANCALQWWHSEDKKTVIDITHLSESTP